jgi:hypothetical protein
MAERMTVQEAWDEVWVAIDDLASLASSLEPENQLDEEEVADGLTTREERYRLGEAADVLREALGLER